MGEYTVSLACSYVDEKMLPVSNSPTRWIKDVLIKINIFSWKPSLDILHIRVFLDRRGLDLPSLLCPLCEDVLESSSHLFIGCVFSTNIVFQVSRWWGLPMPNSSSYSIWLAWL